MYPTLNNNDSVERDSVAFLYICIFKLLKQRAEGLWSKEGGILRLKYLERMTECALA